jgi:hypothetical protein
LKQVCTVTKYSGRWIGSHHQARKKLLRDLERSIETQFEKVKERGRKKEGKEETNKKQKDVLLFLRIPCLMLLIRKEHIHGKWRPQTLRNRNMMALAAIFRIVFPPTLLLAPSAQKF